MEKIIESLSPNERKILPHLEERKISEICKKSNLDQTSVLRALEYLQNKKIVKLSFKKKKIIEIGVNGALYKKKDLPERRLLNLLNEKRILKLQEAQKESRLSNDEFKAAIGALKKKAMIELKNQRIILSANKEEISKKTLEESFIEILPIEYCFAVTEGDSLLLAKLNEGLGIIKQTGKYNEIYNKWFGIYIKPILVKTIFKYVALILLPLLLLLLMALGWSWSLRNQVNKRTDELRKELEERKQIEMSYRKDTKESTPHR